VYDSLTDHLGSRKASHVFFLYENRSSDSNQFRNRSEDGRLSRTIGPQEAKHLSLLIVGLLFLSLPAMGGIIGAGITGASFGAIRAMNFDVVRWAWFPLTWFISLGYWGHGLIPQSAG
jgi:hypothetical protein